MLVTILITLAAMISTGVSEVGLVYAIRPAYEKGDDTGTFIVGILASVSTAVGLLPQYWEIYKRREVVGISFSFLLVDMAGGVFSDLSLVFKQRFNVVAAITYTPVIVSPSFIKKCFVTVCTGDGRHHFGCCAPTQSPRCPSEGSSRQSA